MANAENTNWLRAALEGRGGFRGNNAKDVAAAAEEHLDRETSACAERTQRDVQEVRRLLRALMIEKLREELGHILNDKQGRVQGTAKRLQRIVSAAVGQFFANLNQQREAIPKPINRAIAELLKMDEEAARLKEIGLKAQDREGASKIYS